MGMSIEQFCRQMKIPLPLEAAHSTHQQEPDLDPVFQNVNYVGDDFFTESDEHLSGLHTDPIDVPIITTAPVSEFIQFDLDFQPLLGIPDAAAYTNPAHDTSSSLSLVTTTPVSRAKSLSAENTIEEHPVTPEELDEYSQHAISLGPCSKVWELPPRKRGKRERQPRAVVRKRKGITNAASVDSPRRRGAFRTEGLRQQTADTRKNKSCIRCRMLQDRCRPDPQNPAGSCLNCISVSRPIMCKLPCLRWIITDCSLFREQSMPYQLFSKRWQNMDLVDITTWSSEETKTIVISQIFLDAPYAVEVKEFEPVEGDMLEERWTSGSLVKSHRIPRYALSDMKKTALMLERFIDANIVTYIIGATTDERQLLQDAFRLWVGCRKTSNPHHIYGENKLGADVVDDPTSMFYNVVPMPVIMIAQMECIMYTRVLRPMTKRVLRMLNDLVRRNKKRYWMTIYLTIFILLHSNSMITRRDWETARQYNLQEDFANPESIRRQQSGAQVMLAHFHYLNKGVVPFQLSHNAEGLRELAKVGELDDDSVKFVLRTSTLMKDEERIAKIEEVRATRQFGHDLFWISQLYDADWRPSPTA
ncbi:hypothetical protein GGR51DRAFT_546078 [Nemania sp. FL0031]|nr:hypothetical protein GGR51DRAFT_546078 [Nemania sp. FL0031]